MARVGCNGAKSLRKPVGFEAIYDSGRLPISDVNETKGNRSVSRGSNKNKESVDSRGVTTSADCASNDSCRKSESRLFLCLAVYDLVGICEGLCAIVIFV